MTTIDRCLAGALIVGCATAAPREIDVVASAAFEQALASGDRAIYTALLDERFRDSICSTGPAEFSCHQEAQVRLAILDCSSNPDTEQVLPSHEALVTLLLEAIRNRDQATLTRNAACAFVTGPCESDIARIRVPGPAIAELLSTSPLPDRLELAEEYDGWASYWAKPGLPFQLQLERKPESLGWVWSGYCWSGATSGGG